MFLHIHLTAYCVWKKVLAQTIPNWKRNESKLPIELESALALLKVKQYSKQVILKLAQRRKKTLEANPHFRIEHFKQTPGCLLGLMFTIKSYNYSTLWQISSFSPFSLYTIYISFEILKWKALKVFSDTARPNHLRCLNMYGNSRCPYVLK